MGYAVGYLGIIPQLKHSLPSWQWHTIPDQSTPYPSINIEVHTYRARYHCRRNLEKRQQQSPNLDTYNHKSLEYRYVMK
jgi:hypothetical protein